MPFPRTGREELSTKTIWYLIGSKSEKRDNILDICLLASKSMTQDGEEWATPATLPESANVATEEEESATRNSWMSSLS